MNLFDLLPYAIEGFQTTVKLKGELWTICGWFFGHCRVLRVMHNLYATVQATW